MSSPAKQTAFSVEDSAKTLTAWVYHGKFDVIGRVFPLVVNPAFRAKVFLIFAASPGVVWNREAIPNQFEALVRHPQGWDIFRREMDTTLTALGEDFPELKDSFPELKVFLQRELPLEKGDILPLKKLMAEFAVKAGFLDTLRAAISKTAPGSGGGVAVPNGRHPS